VQVPLMLAKGHATHREIARRCWVRPATLTGIVDALERDGLVARRRSGRDRRQVRLELTDEGRRITGGVGLAIAEWFRPSETERDPEESRRK
jgi:DNA-binding MarR family transcriptional regulator